MHQYVFWVCNEKLESTIKLYCYVLPIHLFNKYFLIFKFYNALPKSGVTVNQEVPRSVKQEVVSTPKEFMTKEGNPTSLQL